MSQFLQKALVDISLSLLSLLAAMITFYINKGRLRIEAETAKLKDERQKILVDQAIERVNDLAFKAVVNAEQTIAEELRAAVKDGKADREDLLQVGESVKQSVYEQLSEDTKELLRSQITDIEAYISDTVETIVRDIKLTM